MSQSIQRASVVRSDDETAYLVAISMTTLGLPETSASAFRKKEVGVENERETAENPDGRKREQEAMFGGGLRA